MLFRIMAYSSRTASIRIFLALNVYNSDKVSMVTFLSGNSSPEIDLKTEIVDWLFTRVPPSLTACLTSIYMYGRDVVGYCHLRLASSCRHPATGQDLIPLQRLHVFAHSRDPHPAIKSWCQVPFTKSKTIFQIEMYCMQCFLKSKYIKVELSMIKIGELLRKLWSLRSCFLILPPGALTPQGIEGAMKRDVS